MQPPTLAARYNPSMNKIEHLEQQIAALSAEEQARFRAWYTAFDADAWDRQIERDEADGKLRQMVDDAVRAHHAGKTTLL